MMIIVMIIIWCDYNDSNDDIINDNDDRNNDNDDNDNYNNDYSDIYRCVLTSV